MLFSAKNAENDYFDQRLECTIALAFIKPGMMQSNNYEFISNMSCISTSIDFFLEKSNIFWQMFFYENNIN